MAFVRHCRRPACQPPRGEVREPNLVSAARCESCSGSDNRRAVEQMVVAMQRAGWTKLLVAGGSPGTRGELGLLCAGRLDQPCRLPGANGATAPVSGPPRSSAGAAVGRGRQRCPVGLARRLITINSSSLATSWRHLPVPSPRAPSSPSPPVSSPDGITVREAPTGTVSRTGPAALPASPVPVMATGASAAPRFTSRSPLT